MAILSKVTIRNFRCFRNEVEFNLNTSTYLIGANNSGKSTLLRAIKCFFEENLFTDTDINSTELASRKTGYNKSEITIDININDIQSKTKRDVVQEAFSGLTELAIKKTYTYKEKSNTIEIQTFINNVLVQSDTQDKSHQAIFEILKAVTVSYIHPQEGIDLLTKAQEKFKTRLFQNWGRHASVAGKIKKVDKEWTALRKTANSYLSSALTQKLQKIWPDSSISINLPEKIEDVVAISDISFKSSPTLPEITLTEQGTGVQSTVLYQTHYILDSDKSLHRGQYYPIWLLEEPESFLHADIATQLGILLNSNEWLKDIQMVISSHSPLILATSQKNKKITNWIILKEHMINDTLQVNDIDKETLDNVGILLGDPNFQMYFELSNDKNQIFIEDTKPITKEKYIEAGIPITKALNGTTEIKRLIDLTTAVPELIQKSIILIIDADKGLKDFKKYMHSEISSKDDFKLYNITHGLFILTLPEDTAVEHLFESFDSFLEESVFSVYDKELNLKTKDIDFTFARYIGKNKGKNPPKNLDEAKSWMQNDQEVKDSFWEKVKNEKLSFSKKAKNALTTLTDYAQKYK